MALQPLGVDLGDRQVRKGAASAVTAWVREHGGDPESIRFFNKIGIDYVSCSPFRLPIARLSSAQAAIEQNMR